MRRRIAYLALAGMVAWAIYGFAHEHLFSQPVWMPEGLVRFGIFTALYWSTAGILIKTRREWLGPAIAGLAFVYSTWWCAIFFHWWAPAAVIYFLGSCWMLGRFFARGVLALIAGLAIWVFVISIAVHFNVNRVWVYAIGFGAPYLGRFRPTATIPGGSWGVAALGYVLAAHFLVALGPEVSSDGLAMHLAIPKMIARSGRFAFDFHQYAWALMPMGGDFAFTAAYLIGGEAAARLLNFAMLVVLAAIVYRVSLRWLPEWKAALAAALFASTPVAQLVSGSLFVENVWAVFIVGAGVALADGEIAVGGMLLGAAFATKVGTSAYLLPAVVIAAIRCARAPLPGGVAHGLVALPKESGTVSAANRNPRVIEPRPDGAASGRIFAPLSVLRDAVAGVVLLVVFAAPPYLNAFRKTGNPVFPFENQIFRSPDFEPRDIMHDVIAAKPPTRNGFYAATFRSSEYIEGQDGAFGFQYFVLLPAMLIVWNRRAPGALIALALAGAASSFISLPNLRYLYPALPLISIGFAWMMAEIPWLAAGAAGLMALNLYFLPAAGWYHKEFAVFTREQWNEYMNSSAPQRELARIVDRTSPGEAVVFFRGEAPGELAGKTYSDTWHTYWFWKRMIACDNASDVTALFHEYRIQHVITPVPSDSPFEVVRNFVGEWTAPAGASRGSMELRTVLPTRMERLKDVAPVTAGTYDDRDWRIEYAGAWMHDRQFKQTWLSSVTYSNVAGDSFRLFFSGTRIDYVFTKAPNRGIAEVWIDRKKRAEIDEYSPKIEWQSRMAFGDLAPGPHTIEIRVTGRRSAGATDVYVDVDAFVVDGS